VTEELIVVDDAELAGLDPFDALDREAAHISSYLSALPPADWSRPSRCEGWSIRDVLAHLVHAEAYHRACLDGEVQAFIREQAAGGATDIASANAFGIAALAHLGTEELLARWDGMNAETRRRFRERGSGVIDTSVGEYSCRWQAFHVAGELATHADDVFAPVASQEGERRRTWRARFSRFALAEEKPDLAIGVEAGRTRIRGQGIDVVLDDDELIEAVAGRLDDSSALDAASRTVLSTMP
jgi:uncharacterized protein (TIGR03083 family)